jgi:hypothetical protein
MALVALGGCAKPSRYVGFAQDCNRAAIPDVEVVAWRNSWLPFRPPENIRSAVSKKDGMFVIDTDEKVDYFTSEAPVIALASHPSRSVFECEESGE